MSNPKPSIHPELREGEIFLTNVGFDFDTEEWRNIGWRTKRMGICAYDVDGKVLEHTRPVFVQRKEMEKAGINLKGYSPYE